MAFTSGSAASASVLMSALNTFLLANGWTKLRGDVDLNVASPKAARWWRVLQFRTQTSWYSSRGIRQLNFRTTPGGANVATDPTKFTIPGLSSGSAAQLISGAGDQTTVNLANGNSPWAVTYDFTVPTVVREVLIRCHGDSGYGFRSFAIQWSNDGETWTTMFEQSIGTSWSGGETRLFTFADGYVHPRHAGAAAPSRSGVAEDFSRVDTNFETFSFRELCEEYFVWQGPGYDASRRVYIHARAHRNPDNLTSHVEFSYSTQYNAGLRGWTAQVGYPGRSLFHMMAANTVNYWFYLNDLRLVLVTQSNVSDFASTYVGFLSAFAHPDYYPFPLCISTMANTRDRLLADTNSGLNSMVDPGLGALLVKKWDGIDYLGGNRWYDSADNTQVSGTSTGSGLILGHPTVWPLHHSACQSNISWPFNKGSGSGSNGGRQLFDFLVPTQQGDLPLIPATVMDRIHGHLGVMSGVYAIPGGGVLAPQQAIVVGADTYRVFPNRSRRAGASWLAIKEN